MIFEMIAYLVWIVLTLAGIGTAFHILQMDRPRPVQAPVHTDELR